MSIVDQLLIDRTASESSLFQAEVQALALERLERGEVVEVESLLPGRQARSKHAPRWLVDLMKLWHATAMPARSAGTRPGKRPQGRCAPHPDPFPGELRLRRLVGVGAFSDVWEAEDQLLGRPVALKAPRGTEVAGSEERASEAIRREAKFLARVHGRRPHPNVVSIYGSRLADGKPYLLLQFVPGGSLAALLAGEGPLPWGRAVRYVSDVAAGLRAVHNAGIVHRDVKPANVLLDNDQDVAMLADMGISDWMTDATSIVGTPSYMAPEAFLHRASPASDVYSLAATLFESLTGQPPFGGRTRRELMSRIRARLARPEPRLQGVPEEVRRVIHAGLAPEPGDRPSLPEFIRLRSE